MPRREVEVPVTTDAGSFTAEVPIEGTLHTIIVGQNTFTAGWTLRVRDLVAGEDILLATSLDIARGKTFRPRVPFHDSDGVEVSGGLTAAYLPGRAEVQITGAGDAKTGRLYLVNE